MARAMKVAIVDDEADMRASISQWLALSGFDTETYASAEEALKVIGPEFPGVVVSDIKMPGMDGMTFLKRLMGMDSGLPVIMITGHGDVPMAVEAMRVGAFDFLEKPFNPDRMTELAKKATQSRRLTLDNRALRKELSDGSTIMKKLIGADNYQWFHSAFVEYNKLRILAVEAGAWYIDHPSKAINKQRNKLIKRMSSNTDAVKNKGLGND